MTRTPTPVHTGDNAKVWTGIRDIPIWAGESSGGNQLPFGPYRTPELMVIGTIMVPAVFWITSHTQSPNVWWVLLGAPLSTVVLVLLLRVVLPKARPTVSARLIFLTNSWLPRSLSTSPAAQPAPRTPLRNNHRPRKTDATAR
jgi:hypothetical protein